VIEVERETLFKEKCQLQQREVVTGQERMNHSLTNKIMHPHAGKGFETKLESSSKKYGNHQGTKS
jgi:hypothetical protein